MDLISIYDAFFYKYTKCREQVALKGLNVQPGPNKGKKKVLQILRYGSLERFEFGKTA